MLSSKSKSAADSGENAGDAAHGAKKRKSAVPNIQEPSVSNLRDATGRAGNSPADIIS